MPLIDRVALLITLRQLESWAESELQVVLVGGSAVVALVRDAEATRDVDMLWTDEMRALVERLGPAKWEALAAKLALSLRADPFEVHLPDDWRTRAVRHEDLSVGELSVFTPSLEDLAVMKLLRFNAKDAQDIRRLAEVPFNRDLFRTLFLRVLPYAIGDLWWHAQSFEMLWNRLYPDSLVEADELMRAAGLTP